MNKKIILVVEDEHGISGAVKIKLENEGYAVLEADSVDSAKILFDEHDVALVWLDHYLRGDKTGLDFIAYVKDVMPETPVFVVTNTASSNEKYSYLKLGADKYYVKTNYSLNDLVEAVKELVD
jgi:DNA-binding response OmpR family regulator